MSNNFKFIPFTSSVLCATALMIIASPAGAQRSVAGPSDAQRPPPQDAPAPQQAPPPTRPQAPPPPPPTREQAQQQRDANARAQQQQQLQEQQRIENARKAEEQERIESARKVAEQERIARARQGQATAATTADPRYKDTIAKLVAAERVHREQLARINRLKQIAQGQKQNDRVADLDRLLLGSNSNFEQRLQAAKTELPEPQYTNTVKMLEQGRRREVRQMMGGDAGGPTTVQREPVGGAVQPPQRVTTPQRQKAPEPSQPPHR